ncbi:hypothetical protein GCM10023231_21260 [Olivibacter ginsenosidimutans]|uniref:Response regulatory domain-containing protein n=1 Tax=Olivibacter ginsenosidimutans TaxID=1176537 RepID=A0ABP9BAK8_9SPHI
MILMIDNCPDELTQYAELFENSPFKTDHAFSGHDALKKIINCTYNLLLLKIQLPDLSGLEIAETIKGLKKVEDVPIFFISDTPLNAADLAKLYQLGAWDCFIKPIDKLVLYHKLRHAVHLHQTYARLRVSEQTLLKELTIWKQVEENKGTIAQLSIAKFGAPLASVNSYISLVLDAIKQGNSKRAIDLLVKSGTQLKKLEDYLKNAENPLPQKSTTTISSSRT